jgi:2-dehydropantoate 2-reductase
VIPSREQMRRRRTHFKLRSCQRYWDAGIVGSLTYLDRRCIGTTMRCEISPEESLRMRCCCISMALMESKKAGRQSFARLLCERPPLFALEEFILLLLHFVLLLCCCAFKGPIQDTSARMYTSSSSLNGTQVSKNKKGSLTFHAYFLCCHDRKMRAPFLRSSKRTKSHVHRIPWKLIPFQSLSNIPTPIPPHMEPSTAPLSPVYILGAGAVGLLLATAIRSTLPTYPVRLLLRETSALLGSLERRSRGEVTLSVQQSFPPPKSPFMNTDAVNRSSPFQQSAARRTHPRLVPIPFEVISLSSSSSHLRQAFSYVLLTTKAHQAKAAIQSIQHRMDSTTTIIILCNGALAVAKELRELPLTSQICTAFTTHGAYRDGLNDPLPHLVHAGYGEVVLHDCATMVRLLDDCGLNARSVESSREMEYLLWQKLAANAVVNPLTALYQCPNGALYDTVPQFASHYLPGIVEEVAAVYRAVTCDTHAAPDDERLFLDYVIQVIAKTAHNRSSSYQDVLQGRQPLEIQYLTGYVLRQATMHNVDCPIQTELYQRLFSSSDCPAS